MPNVRKTCSCLAAAILVGCLGDRPAFAADAVSSDIGTVDHLGDDICLRIAHAGLNPGRSIVVINTAEPQSDTTANIIPGKGCKASNGLTGYRLRLSRSLLQNGAVGVAILGTPSDISKRGRTVAARLAGRKDWLSFRSCASSDGIHVTAWQGRPLAGERMWHGYVFLNQDLDPDCTGRDTD